MKMIKSIILLFLLVTFAASGEAAKKQKSAVLVDGMAATVGKVLITVRDNGPGIAEEIRDRLFDPFVTTKPPGQGTGLGLSICYGIVKRYDGEIRVDSEIERGAEFQVIFPALTPSQSET